MNKFRRTIYYIRLIVLFILYLSCIILVSFVIGATLAGAIGKDLSWGEKAEGIIAIVFVSIVCMYFIRLRVFKILYKLVNE